MARWSRLTAGLVLSTSLYLSGCLSVIRIAKIESTHTTEHWSEEKMCYVSEPCTPRGHVDPLGQCGLFPTMKMRWELLRLTWDWAPPKYVYERRIGLPLALLGTAPGILVDLPVDVLSLPWDWKYRYNSRSLVEDDLPERLARSRCVHCGAISEDGEFALCKRTDEAKTPRWSVRYGVCPDCVETVKKNGYYFEEW